MSNVIPVHPGGHEDRTVELAIMVAKLRHENRTLREVLAGACDSGLAIHQGLVAVMDLYEDPFRDLARFRKAADSLADSLVTARDAAGEL